MPPSRIRRTFSRGVSAVAASIPLSRPGTTTPAGSSPYLAAPVSGAATRTGAHLLRHSLRLSVAEGIFAEVVTACAGGAVLTGWALYLGCSALWIGLIASLPQLAQLVQLPAAWTTSALGHRRSCLWMVGLSRQALLPMVALPFLPLSPGGKQALLVAVAAFSAVLGVLGNNAWVAWMGELVPRAIRGRYFGRRTGLCMLGGALASALAGTVLDHCKARGHVGGALAALALAACVSGAVTTLLMRRQHDPAADAPRPPFHLGDALRPLGDRSTHGLLGFQLAWNFSVGLAGSYFALFMLRDLRMGFTLIALHGTVTAALRMLAAPLWGRAIDRFGARPVLLFCSWGAAVIPLLWLLPTPDFLWPLLLDIATTGPLWGGHAVASFALPLSVAPRQGRPFYLATFAMAGGVAFSVATLLAGALVERFPVHLALGGHLFGRLQLLFVISSVARLGAAAWGLRIAEPSSRPLPELFRALPGLLVPARGRGE